MSRCNALGSLSEASQPGPCVLRVVDTVRNNDCVAHLIVNVHLQLLPQCSPIRAGRIGVNIHGSVDAALPTGGFKQSGWGRERGHEGLHLYTEVKSVIMAL